MRNIVSEADVEEHVLDILKDIGYTIIRGEDEKYLPGGTHALRNDYKEVVLVNKLRSTLKKINPSVSDNSIEEAIKQVLRNTGGKLISDNENFHKFLFDGIGVPIKNNNEERYEKVWLFDFESKKIKKNDFIAMNQFTVTENNIERRPDVVLFVNGIPLLIFELKNLADVKADIWMAYNQFQTYMEQLPSLFRFNEILVISDGIEARVGTISSTKERFMQWKTIDGNKPKKRLTEIEILLRGMCDKQRFLDIVRNFLVFENEKKITKKLAAYHQYWATNKAFESTTSARNGNKKAGIVWHTQGSGKSLTMIFYAGKLVRELDNPTIVVLTDRNDLDDQLFGTFGNCQDIIRQKPRQANKRKDLEKLLKVSSGGIVFTTIQKFLPEKDQEKYPILSERNNIVVIADEAHRSQYGFSAKIISKNEKTFITYGYAKYLRDALPNASFIGFTGTPIEKSDRSTPAVFGKYVDAYYMIFILVNQIDVLETLSLHNQENLKFVNDEESRLAKLTDKQHEQQQERRLSKLEKRADADDKVVEKLEKRIASLEKHVANLKKKI